MNNPLISVIIPFYNVSKYLEEAIESVLSQTYKNWEIVLVDDGSSDDSVGIALKYVRDFPDRIRYFQHPGGVNKGLPASRNLAIKQAKGAYLALLDADDFWLPGKLVYQVSIASQFPQAALICGASQYWYSWADSRREDVVIKVGGLQDQVSMPPQPALMLYPLGEGAAPCPCSVMVKKEVALQYKGFEEGFTGKYQMYEDQAFFMKLYLHEPIFISSLALDRYRQRPDSIMSQTAVNYHEVRYFFLKWLNRYLLKEKIASAEVRRKLKKALWPYKNPFLNKIKSKLTNR